MSYKNIARIKKWFTLIEILIVIVVIGILATSLIPRLTGTQARAKETTIKTKLKDMMVHANIFYIDNKTYNGLCNDESIQSSINELLSMWIKAACYTHAYPNQSYDRAISAWYNGKNYAVNSLWVVIFNKFKPVGTDWNIATASCMDENKRLPSVEQLRALYLAHGKAPGWDIPYHVYWSSTDVPNNIANAYYVHLDVSQWSGVIASGKPKTFSPIYTVCVE